MAQSCLNQGSQEVLTCPDMPPGSLAHHRPDYNPHFLAFKIRWMALRRLTTRTPPVSVLVSLQHLGPAEVPSVLSLAHGLDVAAVSSGQSPAVSLLLISCPWWLDPGSGSDSALTALVTPPVLGGEARGGSDARQCHSPRGLSSHRCLVPVRLHVWTSSYSSASFCIYQLESWHGPCEEVREGR